jgi:hypothetical protein
MCILPDVIRNVTTADCHSIVTSLGISGLSVYYGQENVSCFWILGSVRCGVLCVKGIRNTVHNIEGHDPYSIGRKLDVCTQNRKYIAAVP